MKMNGISRRTRSIAELDAANPPAIAVPEPLALPDARRILDIGRSAVIAVSRAIIARPVIVALGGDCAANNGAADHSGGDASSNPAAARFSRLGRCHGRNSQRGDGSEGHQCLPHGFTFLMEQRTANKRSPSSESSTFRLNDQ